MVKVGERIGAIVSAKNGVVELLGYGVRVEDKVPPSDAAGFGSMLHSAGATNICLQLDDGSEVFGCECWWGGEEAIKSKFADFTVENITVADFRHKASEMSETAG